MPSQVSEDARVQLREEMKKPSIGERSTRADVTQWTMGHREADKID